MITRRTVALIAISTVALASCTSNVRTEQAVAKLTAAKKLDRRIGNDPYADPAERVDAFGQAQRADNTIRRLQSGAWVLDKEVRDACEVPPIAISDETKEEWAKLLKQGERDCKREQLTERCLSEPDRAIEALEQKRDVPWSRIMNWFDSVKAPYPEKAPTPIRHLVVIFQENVSFDHYFGAYPCIQHPTDPPKFAAKQGTPTVNGLGFSQSCQPGRLVNSNPNAHGAYGRPFLIPPEYKSVCSQGHGYKAEQVKYHDGLMDNFLGDKFQNNHGSCTNASNAGHPKDLVMGYYDGNTVTALWNYAQHFAMSDNSYGTTFGPSTPGAINLISGDTSGTNPANLSGGPPSHKTMYSIAGSVIDDPNPEDDLCSLEELKDEKTPKDKRTPMLSMIDGKRNVGDLLNDKGVTWGWFEGGFGGESPCNQSHTSKYTGTPSKDYVPHHEPFQYYSTTRNPSHLPPRLAIGNSDQANHQYDLREFDWILDLNSPAVSLPAVSFLKAPAYQDGHAGYSNPLDEQEFLVDAINKIEKSRFWGSTAVIIAYDDSDGWYDHQMSPIVKSSQTTEDRLSGPNECGNSGRGDQAAGRCGYGPRLPLLVISPWARENFVDHTRTDQTSILKFIEDNWSLGQIGNDSYDAVAGSLLNMFDFSHPHGRKLILVPQTGEIDPQYGKAD